MRLLQKNTVVYNQTVISRRVEDDLETMWQLASKDNRQMKETLRRSLRKLQQHEGLRGIEEDEAAELLIKDAADEYA